MVNIITKKHSNQKWHVVSFMFRRLGRIHAAVPATKKLLLAIALLIQPCSALSILHTTNSGTSTAGTSFALVYSTTPTAGNLLIAFLGVQVHNTDTISPPAGWTQIDGSTAGGVARLFSYYHVVGSGETNSYTFTSTGTVGQFQFVGYEVTGQATSSFVNAHGIATNDLAASLSTPSLTPSVMGTLVLSAASCDSNARTLTSVSSGWTNDVSQTGTFHPVWGASRNSLTSDTTSAITNTFTLSSTNPILAAVVFIAPQTTTSNSQVMIF